MTSEPPAVHEALAVYAPEAPETERVPPGYKLSEVGVIPEDWEVVPLEEIGKFKNGINKAKEDFGHGSPFVNLLDVFGIAKISNNHQFGLVNSSAPERELYNLLEGDVIFVRSSVKPAGVGLTTLVQEDLLDTVFSGFLIRFRENDHLDRRFKEHCFKETGFRNRLVASSTVSANTNINQKALKSLQLPYPPNKHEQRAIAAALSDVDALIFALDKLIAKKRAVKTAAMQQLLTGKQRLAGFSGEWEMRQLGDLGKTYGGITGKSKADFYHGEGEFVTFLNVMNNVVIDLDILSPVDIDDSENQNKVARGDLFFNGSSETPEELGMCSVLLEDVKDVYLNSFCFGFRIHADATAHAYYFAYFFRSGEGRKLLHSLAQGATRYNLSKVNLLKLEMPLPSLEEQTAIAAVLSDMDAEIEALEARREKTRKIKQGMMQELLTGRTRLVPGRS